MLDGSGRTMTVSIVIPVSDRCGDLADLHHGYRAAIEATGYTYEFLYVLDGPQPQASAALAQLRNEGEAISVVTLARYFGESTALMAGFEKASGDIVMTLPSYHQIEPEEIRLLIAALEDSDLAIGYRWPRAGGVFERIRRASFHRFVKMVTRQNFHDLGCGARAMKRATCLELQLYGDLHRFIPVLADRQGFRVREVKVRQSPKDRWAHIYRPREYTRRMLDIFTILFLVRFTKRPLRFFGTIGVSMFLLGALAITIMVIERMFFGQALSERPALLLASLAAVLGLQLLAIGLLGELVIFTHARQVKDYQVAEVVHFPEGLALDAPDRDRSDRLKSVG
jgi:glycosyltransferase involved in cell wall biosynthesis